MAHHCQHCDIEFTNPRCPRCDRKPAIVSGVPSSVDPTPPDEEELDAMVARASRPSLASLVKRGLRAGYIATVADYAHRKPRV